MTKRKTAYHQMFLVDPVLYNRINTNSNTNNISIKQTPLPIKQTHFVEADTPLSPPQQLDLNEQMQHVKTKDSFPPPQTFKSEFAKSLVQYNLPEVKKKPNKENVHEQVKPITKFHTTQSAQSADNQSWVPPANQNSPPTQFHPTRVDASTETYGNKNENIQPQVPMPGPPLPQQVQAVSALLPQAVSALPPPQPVLQPGIVVNHRNRAIMPQTNSASNQNVECMECNETNPQPLQQHPQPFALPAPSQMDHEVSHQFALNYVPHNYGREYIQYNSYPQIQHKASKSNQRAVVRYNPFARMQNRTQSESTSIAPTHQLVAQNRSIGNDALPSIEFKNNAHTLLPTLTNEIVRNTSEIPSIEFQNNERALVPTRTNAITQLNPETDVPPSNMSDYKNYQMNKFICLLCNTEFGTKKGLERHMRQIHEAYQQTEKGQKRQRTFSCDICTGTFQTQSTLNRHVKNMHDAFFQKDKGTKRTRKQKQRPTKYMKYF